MQIDWSKLTSKNFEKLCAVLLQKNGFSNIEWHGLTGNDRGRDIKCERIVEPLPTVSRVEKWLVQCKRYVEKRISKTELHSFLCAAREHKPDTVLLIITDTLNSALKDWLASVRSDFGFEILVWEELQLRRETIKHKKDLLELFPELAKQNDPLVFYRLSDGGTTFVCNEFDEIEIRHINEDDYERAKEHVREFIQYLRNNRVAFDKNPNTKKITLEEEF